MNLKKKLSIKLKFIFNKLMIDKIKIKNNNKMKLLRMKKILTNIIQT